MSFKLIGLIFFALILSDANAAEECPANWIDGAELGCFSFADEGMNWFDGAEYCYYQNAILAQVPDLATQTFLEYHAADIHNGNPEFWLGANDIFTEGSWIWSTSGIKMDFSNWQKGQPDNNEGIQHCLFLGTKDNDFKWGDDKCIQNSKRPLCQKLKTCPEGWLDSPDGCFYFATDTEAKTWDEAVGYCQELGGYLAEVLNEETQNFLVEEATNLGTSTNWWLGATDQDLEGKWIWVKNADPVEFSAWSQNEPNNGGSGEDCLHILVDRGYHWNDAPCDENSLHGYPNKPICQKRFRLS